LSLGFSNADIQEDLLSPLSALNALWPF